MSATGRNIAGHEREPRDFYRTPAWATRSLWTEVVARSAAYKPSWGVIDAGCGDGAIMGEVRRLGHASVRGVEIDEGLAGAAREAGGVVETGDFLAGPGRAADLVVMNPPFSLSLEFASRALREVAPKVAMLGRIGFIETAERIDLLRRFPCDVHVLPGRPKFAHGKTDNCIYAWFAWGFSPGWRWGVLDAAGRPVGRAPK